MLSLISDTLQGGAEEASLQLPELRGEAWMKGEPDPLLSSDAWTLGGGACRRGEGRRLAGSGEGC